jgi:hypothetical protein
MPGKHSDHNLFFWKKKEKTKKCLELPDLARTLISKLFEYFKPPGFLGFFWKKRKVLRILLFREKVVQKNLWKILPHPRKVTTDFTLPPLPSTAKSMIRAVIFCAVRKFGFLNP